MNKDHTGEIKPFSFPSTMRSFAQQVVVRGQVWNIPIRALIQQVLIQEQKHYKQIHYKETKICIYTIFLTATQSNKKNEAGQHDAHRPCERFKHLKVSSFQYSHMPIMNVGNGSGGFIRKNINWRKSNISLVVPLSKNKLTAISPNLSLYFAQGVKSLRLHRTVPHAYVF